MVCEQDDELFPDNPLDRIHSSVPDGTFSRRNEEQAKRDIQALFGEKAKTSFHNITAWYVTFLGWVILLVVAVMLLIRAVHLLAPEKWLWLKPDQISQIDAIILAVLTGIVARFFPSRKE